MHIIYDGGSGEWTSDYQQYDLSYIQHIGTDMFSHSKERQER